MEKVCAVVARVVRDDLVWLAVHVVRPHSQQRSPQLCVQVPQHRVQRAPHPRPVARHPQGACRLHRQVALDEGAAWAGHAAWGRGAGGRRHGGRALTLLQGVGYDEERS